MAVRSIKELKDLRSTKRQAMKDIVTKETDDSPLGDEDVESFEKLKAECEALEARISRLSAAIDPEADDAEEVVDDAEKHWTGAKTKSFNIITADTCRVPRTKQSPGVGRWLVGQWWVKNFGLQAAKDMVEDKMGDTMVTKALTTAQPIIPQAFSEDWIRLLQEVSVVRQLATIYPTPMGNLTIPRQRLGSVGSFISETAPIVATQLAMDNIDLQWFKYAALSYCSKELLLYTPLPAAGIITQDLVSRLALLEDRTFLNGPGGNGAPKRIIASVNATNLSTSTPTPTFQTVSYDLAAAELALTGNLVRGTFTWIMHPGAKAWLKQLSSTFGVFPFKAELDNDQLNGHRVMTTVQLPTNLGTAGANKTNILLVCNEDMIIGDSYTYAVSMTNEGSFIDTGAQVNTFGQDLTAWKASGAVDFALRHDVSCSVLAASGWGLGVNGVAGMDSYVQAPNLTASYASAASS